MASQVNVEAIAKAIIDTLKQRHDGREFNGYWYDEQRAPVNGASVSVLPSPSTFFSPWRTFGPTGLSDVGLVLRIRSNGNDRKSVFSRLYGFISYGIGCPDSVYDALAADKKLGGAVELCHLGDASFGEDEDGPYVDVECFVTVAKQGAIV